MSTRSDNFAIRTMIYTLEKGEINRYQEWPWSICCFSREVKLEITRQEIRYNVLAITAAMAYSTSFDL